MGIGKLNGFFWGVVITCLLFPSEVFSKRKIDPFQSDVHVLLIGFDGWTSNSLTKADMPNLRQMKEQGCWTLKKRSVIPSSSAANWASMFMGASPEIHGYTQWNSKIPEIPSAVTNEHKMFPTISYLLRSQRENAEIGLFCTWEILPHVADTLAINKVVVKKLKDGYSQITKSICDYIVEKMPTFCTIVYGFSDYYGHTYGFESNEYYKSLTNLDKCVGEIIKATKDAGIYDNTIFIVSSDHGGNGKKHGGKTLNEMESPFIIFGNNIKKGHEIGEFMMQFDIAATIAYIFGYEIPQACIGRPVLSVFENLRFK